MTKAKLKVLKPRQAVNKQTIANLQETLRLLRRGELVSVAVTQVYRDHTCENYYDSNNPLLLYGGVGRLKHRIMKDLD